MKKYFFTPRVGKDYEKGFHGIKTLILGSHFIVHIRIVAI